MKCFRCATWPCECADGITLIQGDATKLLPQIESPIHAVITDPPYSTGGATPRERTSQSGRAKYQNSETSRRYPEFAGDHRDQRSYLAWCALWLAECCRLAADESPVAVWTDWRQLPTTTDAIQCAGWTWRGVGVWDKTEGARPQKGRFRNQAEFVVWGSKGAMRTAGPTHAGVWRAATNAEPKLHLTAKPLSVMRHIVAIAADGGTILDPFAGAGTTLLAARESGRRAIGIEMTAEYCAIAAKRLNEGR